MMKAFFALLAICWSFYTATAQNISGTWSGELNTGVMKLGFVLHIDNDAPAVPSVLTRVTRRSPGKWPTCRQTLSS